MNDAPLNGWLWRLLSQSFYTVLAGGSWLPDPSWLSKRADLPDRQTVGLAFLKPQGAVPISKSVESYLVQERAQNKTDQW